MLFRAPADPPREPSRLRRVASAPALSAIAEAVVMAAVAYLALRLMMAILA